MRVYIAGKLDTAEACRRLEKIRQFCEQKGWSTYLPHKDAGFADGSNNSQIYTRDKEELIKADVVLADLTEVDEGACWEVGFALSLGIEIFALGEKRNVMLSYGITYVRSLEEVVPQVRQLITLEGVDGVGKSYYLKKLGLPHDETLSGVGLRLFRALDTNDLFLRGGNPLSEALTLLAVDLTQQTISDRGLDTIALYYALQTDHFYESYFAIYMIGKRLGRAPTKTILLVDDFDQIVKRLELREKRELTPNEKDFLFRAYEGFLKIAELFPWRFFVVDLRHTVDVLAKIRLLIEGGR